MKNNLAIVVMGIATLAALIVNTAQADSTKEQLAAQTRGNQQSEATGDELKPARGGRLNEILTRFAYLDAHFQLMDEFGVEAKLEASLEALRKHPGAVDDLIQLYIQLTEASAEDYGDFGEARWRALHVLGELRDERAASRLFEVATQDMPSAARVTEKQYAVEYRIRARAIAGLERLRKTDLLRRIYEDKGLFRGLAAASLYELGQPPRGVAAIDGRKILGLGDPKDYNPRRGETPQQLPPGQIKRKAGDDDEPAVSPGKSDE